jgi:hypothetical protein
MVAAGLAMIAKHATSKAASLGLPLSVTTIISIAAR